MTDQSTTPEPQDLVTVPGHHNDLGDYCPSGGQLTADGTCPQYCREADELVGFDAGRDEDEPELCSECGADLADDEGEGYDGLCGSCADRAEGEGRWSGGESEQHGDTSEAKRCVYCQATGALEPINAQGNQACANTVTCQLRAQGTDPADHLLTVARAVGKDAAQLSTAQLADLVYVVKAAVAAFEGQLVNRPDRDRETERAARDHLPRTAAAT